MAGANVQTTQKSHVILINPLFSKACRPLSIFQNQHSFKGDFLGRSNLVETILKR